jgi:hypothetical protein
MKVIATDPEIEDEWVNVDILILLEDVHEPEISAFRSLLELAGYPPPEGEVSLYFDQNKGSWLPVGRYQEEWMSTELIEFTDYLELSNPEWNELASDIISAAAEVIIEKWPTYWDYETNSWETEAFEDEEE